MSTLSEQFQENLAKSAAQAGVSASPYRFLAARFIAVYLLLGVLGAGAVYADIYSITHISSLSKKTARVVKKVDALTNDPAAVTAAEKQITSALESNGALVTGYHVLSVKEGGGKATVVLTVTFTDPASGKSQTLKLKVSESTSAVAVDSIVKA